MQNKNEIGQRVRLLREAHGYTHEVFAEMIEVSPRYCYDLELGNKGMSLNTLCMVAKALDTSTDYLLFGSKESNVDDSDAPDPDLFLSIVQACPHDKRKYLLNIMTNYLEAIR